MAYKEIVTKAVIGKGKKKYKSTYEVEVAEKPSTVLGCWIINHNFSAKTVGEKILINGSFDANIWYSYDNDTKTAVTTKNIAYTKEEKLNNIDENIVNKDIIVRSLKQPTCISAKEDENKIILEIEKELGIEIIGDTKVKISSVDDADDNWDILGDEENKENTKSEVNNQNESLEPEKINENYIDEEIIK